MDFEAAVKKHKKEPGCPQSELSGYCGYSTVHLLNLKNSKEAAEIGKALLVAGGLGLDLIAMKAGKVL